MKNMKKPDNLSRLPLTCILATTIALAGCSGDQLGDTNGGFAAGGNTGVVLGAIGAVALAGAILASDDDDDDNDAEGATTTAGTTTAGTATAGATTAGTTTGGTTTGGTATGGDTTGGTTTGGDTTGGTTTGGDTAGGTTGGDTAGGTTTGGDTAGGTTTGGDTAGGTTTGGDTMGGTPTGGTMGGNAGPVTLGQAGEFQSNLVVDGTIPMSTSTGQANAALAFNRATGDVSGDVVLSGITVTPDTRVDIMVGPPGANGFVGVELEMTGPDTWSVPAVLSDDQRNVILQNLNAGNLYVATRTAEFPNGELRRQILPDGVSRYTTSGTGTTGGNAEGFVMLNMLTGEYAITWNTEGAEPLATAHVNDGVVSGPTENNLFSLSQRQSNPEQFFGFGNFMDVNDPLPDLLTRLDSDQGLWLDAHAVSDDSRVFQSRLTADPL